MTALKPLSAVNGVVPHPSLEVYRSKAAHMAIARSNRLSATGVEP